MVAEVQPLLDQPKTSTFPVFANLLADLLDDAFSALGDVASQSEHQLGVIYELRACLIEDFEDVVALG